MTTINAALLQKQFNTDTSAANAETIIDGSINLLNTFGADINNLTGTAGTKTGDYTSAQTGAIMTLAQQIYAKHYTNPTQTSSTSLGPAGLSYGSDTQLLTFAKRLADALKRGTVDPPIFLSNDPMPT